MASQITSPPTSSPSSTSSPPNSSLASLPPLITNSTPTRRTTAQRPPSFAKTRMSTYSNTSRASQNKSRRSSRAVPSLPSNLPFTLIRDFAYPGTHPMHYGPLPQKSGLSTPASESRRLSDPAVSSWDESRGQWSATPPWFDEVPHRSHPSNSREKLPAMTFSDDHGPPYSEDEDLHSPVVTTSRHKKHKSSASGERGRSPADRGVFVGLNGDGSETYYVTEGSYDDSANGPGGELVTYPPEQARHSHLLSPHYTNQTPYSSNLHSRRHGGGSGHIRPDDYNSEDADSDGDDEDESARYSRNYSFTIASPDEEMHGKAVALFDFAREHENELPLTEGQVILVSYRHGQGWLVAEDPMTGESGLVPEEFVRLLRDIEGGLGGLQNAQTEAGNGGGFGRSAQEAGAGSGSGNGSGANMGKENEMLSPAVVDGVDTPTAPTRHGQHLSDGALSSGRHSSNPSNGSQITEASSTGHAPTAAAAAAGAGGGKEKHPPVQSSFSTSRTDFEGREKRERDKEKEKEKDVVQAKA